MTNKLITINPNCFYDDSLGIRKDRIVYFDLDAPLAEFYDYDCRPIKVVKGGAEYPFGKRDGKKGVCLTDYLPYAYIRKRLRKATTIR